MDFDRTIDFSRLVGFEQVTDELRGGVDFRDDAVGARLGAKRGAEGEAAGVVVSETDVPTD